MCQRILLNVREYYDDLTGNTELSQFEVQNVGGQTETKHLGTIVFLRTRDNGGVLENLVEGPVQENNTDI